MGIGDFINFAVSSVGTAVSCIPVHKLPESVQDPETQARIKHFASILGKNAAESALLEGLKFLPGGYLISKTILDFHKSGGGED